MTYSDLEENDLIAEHFIERDGRGFKIKRYDPHGYWKIFHARNNQPVIHIPGEFTSLDAAKKAVMAMPEDKLPARPQHKQVLTPKSKKEVEED